MVATFLDHNSGELKPQRRRRQRERQKSNRFILAKQQLCTCITLFCTFLNRRCKSATWNFLISRACLWGWWTQHKNFLCLFLKSDTVLSNSIPDDFAKILQTKWNWIRSMKFETVRIHLLRDVFALLSSRNIATMGTWRNDFSALFHQLLTRLVASNH